MNPDFLIGVNISPALVSLFFVFLAELGDKTQFLTIGLSTKYKKTYIFAGILSATIILMGIAVFFGSLIGNVIPMVYINFFSGIIFIFFGINSFLEKEKEEKIHSNDAKKIFLIVFTTFFLAELGDKTEVMAFTLAAKYDSPLQVWLGSTLAMISVNTISIFLGYYLKNLLPQKTIKIISSAVFLIFGFVLLLRIAI